jgi:hypothetical protein
MLLLIDLDVTTDMLISAECSFSSDPLFVWKRVQRALNCTMPYIGIESTHHHFCPSSHGRLGISNTPRPACKSDQFVFILQDEIYFELKDRKIFDALL